MTAIIGYINKSTDNKLAMLVADDLEAISESKVDKLSKINDRFTVGFVGLEIVHWAIIEGITCINGFDNNWNSFDSIEELQDEFTSILALSFKRWKETNVFGNEIEQINQDTIIIIMDNRDKCLYYCSIGKPWDIPKTENWKLILQNLKLMASMFLDYLLKTKNIYLNYIVKPIRN